MILGIRQTMDQEDNSGSPEDLSHIITATEYMDGLDHTDATAAQLETAIKQITRRGTRRDESTITPPSIPTIDGYENGSAFAITVTQKMIDEDFEGRGGFTFGFYGITLKSGHSSYSVHWGDGTQNTGLNVSITAGYMSANCFGNTGSSATQTGTNGTVTDGTAEVCHTYTAPGIYVIQISDDINWFGMGGRWGSYDDPWNWLIYFNKPILAIRTKNSRESVSYALRFGAGVTIASCTYAKCLNLRLACEWNNAITLAQGTYQECPRLTGPIPAWGSAITNSQCTYYGCTGLTGSIPVWNSVITNIDSTYYGCTGLTGSVPAWGLAITNTKAAYRGCTGLTGSIPAWNSVTTNTSETYRDCTGITGSIPAWNSVTTNASATYYGCTGLTGSVPAWGSAIIDTSSAYWGCAGLTGSIPAWNSVSTNVAHTYKDCTGLSGTIPAWNSVTTNASNAYSNCAGLTGTIPEWESTITSTQGTYGGCTGLTGSVPAWGSAITNAYATYSNCFGLTGNIPAWGSAITQASYTYENCKGLTGVWDPTTSDAELMPSAITGKSQCVGGCHLYLRQYFLTTWGGTRAN